MSEAWRYGTRGPYKWPNGNARWTEYDFRRAVAASGTIAEAARRLGGSTGRTTVAAGIARLGLDTSHFRGFGHVTDSVRFWRKVEKSSGCWRWTDKPNHDGYGRFKTKDGRVMAHVFAFVETVGPVPSGLELDHTCNNRSCVRPSHLEAVTHIENVRRAVQRRAV